jgi:DNA-binding NarL/FixJ family response regulator
MSESRIRLLLALTAIGAFVLIMTLEVVTESDDFALGDVLVDGLVLLLTIGSAETRQVLAELEEARRDGAGWRAAVDHHVEGLKAAIDEQFNDWRMTEAERDVALLILKGLCHKEIAALRDTSERTVRQQAQQVYRKSGLSGKNALSAFFLEDLLSPNGVRKGNGADRGQPASSDAATLKQR